VLRLEAARCIRASRGRAVPQPRRSDASAAEQSEAELRAALAVRFDDTEARGDLTSSCSTAATSTARCA